GRPVLPPAKLAIAAAVSRSMAVAHSAWWAMEVTLLSSSSPTSFLTADLQSDVGSIARRKRIGCRGWICANATWVRARHAAVTLRGKEFGTEFRCCPEPDWFWRPVYASWRPP